MPQPVNIDTIHLDGNGRVQGSGNVAQMLAANNFNVNALRTNDVLRKDEWVAMDNVLIEIGRKRLVAIQEMASRGLTYNISNGLGTTSLEWEQVSDMEPAEVSMSGITEGENDTLDFALQNIPLPIIHKDFNINIRKLEASRSTGQSLDLAQVEMASRLVAEATEEMFFKGHGTQVGASKIYGLLNAPHRNEGAASDWDVSGTTGETKVNDLISMIMAAQNDHMYGPFGLWITNAAMNHLNLDYKSNGDKTQYTRLLELEGIDFIRSSRDIPASNIVLQQLTRDVADVVVGLQPTIVQWESNGGMTQNFKVLSIMIPRVRSTVTEQSGIVHFT